MQVSPASCLQSARSLEALDFLYRDAVSKKFFLGSGLGDLTHHGELSSLYPRIQAMGDRLAAAFPNAILDLHWYRDEDGRIYYRARRRPGQSAFGFDRGIALQFPYSPCAVLFLAFCAPVHAVRYCEKHPFQAQDIYPWQDPSQMHACIEAVRHDFFIVQRSLLEQRPHLRVSLPVFSRSGQAWASITVNRSLKDDEDYDTAIRSTKALLPDIIPAEFYTRAIS